MSLAYECNRCGVLFKHKTNEITVPSTATLNEQLVSIHVYDAISRKELDYCDGCLTTILVKHFNLKETK